MVSKNSHHHSISNLRYFIISLFLISLSLIILALSFHDPKPTNKYFSTSYFQRNNNIIQEEDHNPVAKRPEWLKIIEEKLGKEKANKKIKLGLVNLDRHGQHDGLRGLAEVETVPVRFDRLTGDNKREWEEYFPEWIDEHNKWGPPRCPDIPLPALGRYADLDVVVASVPCGNSTKRGVRDVFRLQVNMVAANLAVKSGWGNHGRVHRMVYVVFVGSCGPMVEIFRCDDLVKHQKGEYWVYRPEMRRLKQKVLMPVGSCQLAPGYAETGKERWKLLMPDIKPIKSNHTKYHHHRGPRYAYATVLHSSEAYVCGAIALAQSIRRTNSTKDLVLLADTSSLSAPSLRGLRSAGWTILPIHRIRSPFAAKGAYNEWNYSKLRVFQLTHYDKIIFIDSDLVVLNNMDRLFVYPPLSAAANDKFIFNSGVMVIEPSLCLFETLMRQSFQLDSYNGGDQGFLNEAFTWWHRLPKRVNYLKIFRSIKNDEDGDGDDEEGGRRVFEEVDAIHYLGLKPWMCYRDYDCNWDMADHRIFASDSAHRRWWEIYDGMPEKLQRYCGLTRKMDARIRKWRGIARKVNLRGGRGRGRWMVRVKDPRQYHFVNYSRLLV